MIKKYIQIEILSKLEGNKRKKDWKEKLMLIDAPISRFATPTSPFASFSLLLLQPSSMEVWESLLKLSYEHTLSYEPDLFSFLKAKTSSNRTLITGQNEASHEKPPQLGNEGPPRPWLPPRAGRGGHHRPWWWPRATRGAHWWSGSSSSLERCILPSALNRGLLVLGYLHWAFWSCLLPL